MFYYLKSSCLCAETCESTPLIPDNFCPNTCSSFRLSSIQITIYSGFFCKVAYDSNGNITDLVNNDGALLAHYQYSAYGEVIAMSGSESENNPMRFSTKYWEKEFRKYRYGYRDYDPETERWTSRDPLGVLGSLNLYNFGWNDAVNTFDYLGLEIVVLPYWERNERTRGQRKMIESPTEIMRQHYPRISEYEKDYDAFKARIEQSIAAIKACCNKYPKQLGQLGICKLINSSERFPIIVGSPRARPSSRENPPVDNGTPTINDISLDLPYRGGESELLNEVYSHEKIVEIGGSSLYAVRYKWQIRHQTVTGLIAHEAEHVELLRQGKPSADDPKNELSWWTGKERWSNKAEKAAVAGENRLRECCPELGEIFLRDRYMPLPEKLKKGAVIHGDDWGNW